VAFHPTLTRSWSHKGRRGQRLVEAPGDNRKVSGLGLVDWREGWFDGRVAPGQTAAVFCEHVRAAVARSKRRGRIALVITDQLKTHTSAGSLLVRSMLTALKEQLYLVYTPASDPDANRIAWLWRVSRRVVTHHHHRSEFERLLADRAAIMVSPSVTNPLGPCVYCPAIRPWWIIAIISGTVVTLTRGRP
jgi:hypothetical protein